MTSPADLEKKFWKALKSDMTLWDALTPGGGDSILVRGGQRLEGRIPISGAKNACLTLMPAALLTGVGFTVSLLVGELAFGAGSERDEHVKVAILTGSLLAACLAAVVLRVRNRVHRRIHEEETADTDADGIPDVYQDDTAVPPGARAVSG